MNAKKSEISRSATRRDEFIRAVFLLPAAITVIANYKDTLEIGHQLAELCRYWLLYWRGVWQHIFAAWNINPPEPSRDMMTLLATLLGASALSSMLAHANVTPITATQIVQRLTGWARWRSFLAAALMGACSAVYITVPFVDVLWISALSDPANTMLWLGLFLLFFAVFFYLQMSGEHDELDWLRGIPIFLLVIIGLVLVSVLLKPSPESEVYAMQMVALGFCLVVSRSVLPLIQIAVFALAVLALDSGVAFLSSS